MLKDFEGHVLGADAFWARFASRMNRVFFGFALFLVEFQKFYRCHLHEHIDRTNRSFSVGPLDPLASEGGASANAQ
jgi:hypothetical protein